MNLPSINPIHALLGAMVMVGIGATGLNWVPARQGPATPPPITEEFPTLFGDDPRFDDAGISRFTLRSRADEVEAWLAQLNLAACPAALKSIVEHPAPQLRQRWVSTLFQHWAQQDRRGARASAQAIASPELRRTALEAVIAEWSDFNATWAWWQSLKEADTADLVLEAIIARHLPKAPPLVANQASHLSDPFQRQRALEKVAYAWTGIDEHSALTWALQQHDPMVREQVIVPPLRALCAHDVLAGFRIAEKEYQVGARRVAMNEVFAAIGRFDAVDPVLRYIQFTDDMQPAMRVLGLSRAGSTSSRAIAVAAKLPEGALRDAFLLGAAEQLASEGKAAEIKALLDHCGPGAELEEMRALASR